MVNEKYLRRALERFPHKCFLISILSKRVEQLNNGARPQVESDALSNLDIALKEIGDEKILVDLNWEESVVEEAKAKGSAAKSNGKKNTT